MENFSRGENNNNNSLYYNGIMFTFVLLSPYIIYMQAQQKHGRSMDGVEFSSGGSTSPLTQSIDKTARSRNLNKYSFTFVGINVGKKQKWLLKNPHSFGNKIRNFKMSQICGFLKLKARQCWLILVWGPLDGLATGADNSL